jgi:hypothetical protein
MDDANAECVGIRMPGKLRADEIDRSGKQERNIEVTRSSQSAVNDAAGSMVAPHGVYGNPDHEVRFVLAVPVSGQASSLQPVMVAYVSSTARTWRPR